MSTSEQPSFGRLITIHMANADMRQTGLADAAGISKAWLSELVNDKVAPRFEDATAIADALSLTGDNRKLFIAAGGVRSLDPRFVPFLRVYEQIKGA